MKKIITETTTALAILMIALAVAGLVWAVVVIVSDIDNQKIKKCRETPLAELQDTGLYNKCMEILK